jgi:hypothetical protein
VSGPALDHRDAIFQRHSKAIMRSSKPAILILLAGASLLLGCANPEQERARQLETAAADNTEDDSACREQGGGPGQEAYDKCRQALSEARAREGAIQEQKRRDFDRVLGAGTHDY